MDGATEPPTFAQVGYTITGSGGGGSNGQYVFADLQELDSIIADLETLRENIRYDGDKLRQAQQIISPPGEDEMSQLEAQTTIDSLGKAVDHNEAMVAYADTEITRMRAARDTYMSADDAGAERLHSLDGK